MSIANGFTDTMIQAFSWMLIHSLWQGALLAFVAGIVLMLSRKATASVRYNLVLMLFSVFLLTVACTFYYEWNNVHPSVSQSSVNNGIRSFSIPLNTNVIPSASITVSRDNTYTIKTFVTSFNKYFSEHCFLVVMLWFIFFIAKSVSLAGNMVYMHRARHYRVYAPDDHWKEKIASLCENLQLKKAVLLLESGYVKVPVVIGYFKPVILLPVGLIAGIPMEQVEAVLLHELAHIKRNDYVVNFLQSIAEAIFFFNPGLLWISKLLKEERENCCDDIAIAQSNNKEAFVEALINFKDHADTRPAYAVAFSGQKSNLLNRVMRIVYQENKTLSIKENGIFIMGIVMLLLTAFTVYPVKEAKWVKPITSLSKTVIYNINEQLKKRVIAGSVTTNIVANNVSDVDIVKEEPVINNIADEPILITPQTEQGIIPNKISFGTGEVKNRSSDARLDNTKIYTRIPLKDSVNDLVRVRFPGGRGAMTTLRHNAKVAFIINGVIHEESEAANFTQPQIDALSTEPISIGDIVNAGNMYPDLDLSKYGAYIAIGNKLNKSTINKGQTFPPDD